MIGARQYREMESRSASAPPAREPVNIEAVGRVAERETNASDPLLMALEARGERETTAPCPRETAMSMQAWETKMLKIKTAAVRRDGELLTSAAQERQQEETGAEKLQVAAGEPASSPGGKTADPGIPHMVCPEVGPDDSRQGRMLAQHGKTTQVEPPPTRFRDWGRSNAPHLRIETQAPEEWLRALHSRGGFQDRSNTCEQIYRLL
jgi:hypothetical protein